jgi:hypothetical protein
VLLLLSGDRALGVALNAPLARAPPGAGMPISADGAATVADLVDFVVARICDQLGVPNALIRRWGEET